MVNIGRNQEESSADSCDDNYGKQKRGHIRKTKYEGYDYDLDDKFLDDEDQ